MPIPLRRSDGGFANHIVGDDGNDSMVTTTRAS
jgi:hypothetical protein